MWFLLLNYLLYACKSRSYQNIIHETGLTPEELLLLKNAFDKAKILAKDKKLAIELENAIAENDLAKVKSLLGETSANAKKGHTYPDFDEQSVNFNRFRDKKAHRTEIADAKPGDYLKHKKAKTVEQVF